MASIHRGRRASAVAGVLVLALALSLPGGLSAAAVEPPIRIADAGAPAAVIVTRPDAVTAAPVEHEAAVTLQLYIQKASGAQLQIRAEADIPAGESALPRLYVGALASPTRLQPIKTAVDALQNSQAFIVRALPAAGGLPAGLALVGGSVWGTDFAVSRFLESSLGILWLMPNTGDRAANGVGEHVPAQSTIDLPGNLEVVSTPSFSQRVISPYPVPDYKINGAWLRPLESEWARRNLLYGNMKISHNLYQIFKPSLYRTTHPEYFPETVCGSGTPRIPANDATAGGWQPRFTQAGPGGSRVVNEGTARVAAEAARAYFVANPNELWFSLAVNDHRGFDACDLASVTSQNSIGVPNASEFYLPWLERVLEIVDELNDAAPSPLPHRSFGFLAYDYVKDPLPETDLARFSNTAIPFITEDRMSWLDSATATASQDNLSAWSARVKQVGMYDYTYGAAYIAPRVYNEHFADVIATLTSQNVTSAYIENYAGWAEGPKPWLTARMLWDATGVQNNLEELEDQWCTGAVGEDAAGLLCAHYDEWEAVWTSPTQSNRVTATPWFKNGLARAYMPYTHAGYAAGLSDDDVQDFAERMDDMIAAATADPDATADQKTRANVIYDVWSQYEYKSLLTYPREVTPVLNDGAARAIMQNVATEHAGLNAAAWERIHSMASWSTDILRGPSSPVFDPFTMNLVWSGWNGREFWSLVEFLRSHPGTAPLLRAEIAAQIAGPDPEMAQYAALLVAVADETAVNKVQNPGFENAYTGTDPAYAAANWSNWSADEPTVLGRSAAAARSGAWGLSVVGAQHAGPQQVYVPVRKGDFVAFRGWIRNPAGGTSPATVQVSLAMQATGSTNFTKFYGANLTSVEPGSDWQEIRFFEKIPTTIEGSTVQNVHLVITVDGVPEGQTLYLDDLSLLQVAP